MFQPKSGIFQTRKFSYTISNSSLLINAQYIANKLDNSRQIARCKRVIKPKFCFNPWSV